MITWKPVVGFEDRYEVSSDGVVRPLVGRFVGRPLSTRLLKGYPGVSLGTGTSRKHTATVHSLVMAAFEGPRPTPRHQINHKNGIKTDNRWPDNLEYVTCAENIHHAWKVLGNCRYGISNPFAKLGLAAVEDIRNNYIPGKSGPRQEGIGLRFFAEKYGVTKHAIHNVIQGKNWIVLEKPIPGSGSVHKPIKESK